MAKEITVEDVIAFLKGLTDTEQEHVVKQARRRKHTKLFDEAEGTVNLSNGGSNDSGNGFRIVLRREYEPGTILLGRFLLSGDRLLDVEGCVDISCNTAYFNIALSEEGAMTLQDLSLVNSQSGGLRGVMFIWIIDTGKVLR